MSPRKPRILFCNESSYLPTGFSTYGLEVLKRWHATGKYDLMELGSYGEYGDPRARGLPWKYMHVKPNPADQAACELYQRNDPVSAFGEFKFEQACIQHSPDIVVDCRDWWMLEYQQRSPFRPYYHWAIMPTVDASPQDESWLSTFIDADAVFTYSDWATELLKKQGGGKIKLKGQAPPGADLVALQVKPDKQAHRREMGIDPDCFVVGTIMRNQKRKLYPDLIQGFAQYLREAPLDLAKKTFLYLHVGWPDIGWDIPRLVKEAGVSHRTVFTYYCRACGAVYPSFFADAKTFCKKCGQMAAGMTDSHMGISRKGLGDVISMFDVYIQYANSEGFGMPQVEAAACGVPVMAVDYSAMSDVVRRIGGMPIRVKAYHRETETHCYRAIPDNDDFVRQLISFLSKPEAMRQRQGYLARKACEEFYNYDRTAKLWEDHFDSVPLLNEADTWSSPAHLHTPNTNVPSGLTNEGFVNWGLLHIAGRPDLVDSYLAMRMTRDLNLGSSIAHMGGMYFNEASTLGVRLKQQDFFPNHAAQQMVQMCEKRNLWEKRRVANGKAA